MDQSFDCHYTTKQLTPRHGNMIEVDCFPCVYNTLCTLKKKGSYMPIDGQQI